MVDMEPSAFDSSEGSARGLDRADPLAPLRGEFIVPRSADGGECVYLAGHSLGLQPRGARRYIEEELEDWGRLGVEGHFEGRHPWLGYH